MPYQPTDLGLAAQDARPYGAGAQEQEDARARQQAARSTATATASGGGAGPVGGNNPGYMRTIQDETAGGAQPKPPTGDPGASRDESERQTRMHGAQPSALDLIGDVGRENISKAASAITHIPLIGGLANQLVFSPVRTLGWLADTLVFDPGKEFYGSMATEHKLREQLNTTKDPQERATIQSQIEAEQDHQALHFLAGSMGDTSGVKRVLEPVTVEAVSRLSSIAQRLEALGLGKDAKLAADEMRSLAASAPDGLATQDHVHMLEDIINTKQTGGHYAGRQVEQSADLARLKAMRDGVAKRAEQTAAAAPAADNAAEGFPPGGLPNPKAGEKPQAAGAKKNAAGGEQPKPSDPASTDAVAGKAPTGGDVSTPPPGQKPPAPPAPRDPNSPTPMGSPTENLGINLTKIDAPQHVKDLIEVEARAHLGDITAQRRGVQPLEVIFAKAKNLGIDVPSLAQIQKGTAFNAEGAVAIFNSIIKTAGKRVALEEEIRQAGVLATPEMEAKWLAAVYDQNTLQRVFAGGRAEAGRSLRVLRELQSGVNSGQIKDTFSRALEAIGGRAKMDQLLQRLKDIQTNPSLSPLEREMAAFKFVGQLDKPKFWSKINEAFINSILSNPLTHEANILGQSALIEADTLAQYPAALLDTILSGAGKIRPRERTFTAAITQTVATHAAVKRALSEALLYMRHGVAAEDVEKFRESGVVGPAQALQGSSGTILNLPTRALGAEDVFFNRLGYQRQLYQDAANYVAKDGSSSAFSRDYWHRVADIAAHPEDFQMEGASIADRSSEAGRRAGLRQSAGDFERDLQRVLHWEVPEVKVKNTAILGGGLKPGVFIAPFVRIGFNLARVGTEYSPLGFVNAAKQTGGARADSFGRAVVGTALWWEFWQKADAKELTGAAPTDPKAAAQFYDEGKRPYAIKVGDKWVEYGRYEPVATTLKWVVGMHEAQKELAAGTMDPKLYGATLLKAIGSISRSLTDSSFLQGINDFYSIMTASDATAGQKAEKFAANLANSVAPFSGLRRFIAQREDSTLHHPSGFLEQIEAANPAISHMVKPYLTHWGEPVARPDLSGGITSQQEQIDPVDVELHKVIQNGTLTVDGADLDPKTLNVQLVQADIDNLKLSESEGFMLQQVAGRATHTALADLFSDHKLVVTESKAEKRYSAMNDREKQQAVSGTISEARRIARATVADAILATAETPEEIRRAAKMRLSTISKVSDRAAFLSGLDRQHKLPPEVRDYLNRTRGKGERTVDEYLRLVGF